MNVRLDYKHSVMSYPEQRHPEDVNKGLPDVGDPDRFLRPFHVVWDLVEKSIIGELLVRASSFIGLIGLLSFIKELVCRSAVPTSLTLTPDSFMMTLKGLSRRSACSCRGWYSMGSGARRSQSRTSFKSPTSTLLNWKANGDVILNSRERYTPNT